MLKKITAVVLIVLLLNNICTQAQSDITKQEATNKRHVMQWGLDQEVRIKLNSGEKVVGNITEIKQDRFSIQILTNGKFSGRQLSYGEVKSIKRKMEFRVPDEKIAMIVAFAFAVVAPFIFARHSD